MLLEVLGHGGSCLLLLFLEICFGFLDAGIVLDGDSSDLLSFFLDVLSGFLDVGVNLEEFKSHFFLLTTFSLEVSLGGSKSSLLFDQSSSSSSVDIHLGVVFD